MLYISLRNAPCRDLESITCLLFSEQPLIELTRVTLPINGQGSVLDAPGV